MKRRKWTVEQKLSILKEAEENGIPATIRKYSIFGKTLYDWKEKLASGGPEALGTRASKTDPELKRLQKENQQLKELLAEKELALRIKDDLLKKSTFQNLRK